MSPGSWPALAVALAAALAYLPSFAGVFHFDDYNVIVNYPTVHSWQGLAQRASGDIGAAARRKRHQDAQGLGRERLRRDGAAQCGEQDGKSGA